MPAPLAAVPSSPAGAARHAAGLRGAACAVLALLPPGMALANKSGPAILTIAASLALLAALLDGRLAAWRRVQAGLGSPPGLAACAFLGLCAASLSWSEVRSTSLAALGEFVLPVLAGLVLAAALNPLPRWMPSLLAAASLLAGLLILVELATGLALHRALRMRSDTYILNRSSLTLLVVMIPLLAMAARRGVGAPTRITAGLAAALACAAVLRSDSGAAVVGLLAAVLAYALARLRPAAALWVSVAGLAAAFALAPVAGDGLARVVPARVHERLAEAHSGARVEIWQSFGASIRAQPWCGAGFGASARLADTSVVERVALDSRPLLASGHPHNAAIQVWAELGAVGAGLALLVLLLCLRALWPLPAPELAPALALFAAAAAVSLVGHGAWQGWWVAALAAALVLMPDRREAPP